MDTIANHLRDPGWWFTAVIMAIIAGIVAGFSKDYLEKRYDLFLLHSAKRRQEARLLKERSIEAWSENESVLIIDILQTLYYFIGSSLLTILMVMTLQFNQTKYGVSQLSNLRIFGLFLLFVLTFRLNWVFVKQALHSNDCLRRFCKAKGLPLWRSYINW